MNIKNKVVTLITLVLGSLLHGSDQSSNGMEVDLLHDGAVNLRHLQWDQELSEILTERRTYRNLSKWNKYKADVQEKIKVEGLLYQKQVEHKEQNESTLKSFKSLKQKKFQQDKFVMHLPSFEGKPVVFTKPMPTEFYAETTTYTLAVNPKNKKATITEDLDLLYPANLSMESTNFIKNRAFEKQKKVAQNHSFYRTVNHHKQVAKYNSHALTSLGVSALSGIVGLVMLSASSTDKIAPTNQHFIPLALATVGLAGYCYFINQGKKAAAPLYQKELEADYDAVLAGKDKNAKLNLITGGLQYLKNERFMGYLEDNNIWQLEDPARWFTVSTSVPFHRRIKQLNEMKVKIEKEQL